MSRSFFTFTNDLELAGASAIFSAAISLSPGAYGLDGAITSEYAARHLAFSATLVAIGNKNIRTTSLVIAKNDARAALVSLASDLAKRIDGTGTVSDEQRSQLGLSIRKAPAPLPPPGKAQSFVLTLTGNGDVHLKWKCANPRGAVGTMYNVYRQINDEMDYTYLASVGAKQFTDATLPAGATRISYQVQAVRSTAKGDWATFDVLFGKRQYNKASAAIGDFNVKAAA